MKIKIIPAIDLIDGQCVRLSQGDYGQVKCYASDPTEVARRFVAAGFRDIHVVDLDGAKASSPVNLAVLEELAVVPGARIEWGGGIKSDEALIDVLDAGATYAVIGSVAAVKPELFEKWLGLYGGERIVFGADLKDGKLRVGGWLDDADHSMDSLMKRFMAAGLKRTISTDISRDGMLTGPTFEMYADFSNRYPGHDFTVSGGISGADDIRRLESMGLHSVIVGKALYENRITLEELSWLQNE